MNTSARLSRPELHQDTEAEPQTGAVSLLAATRRILEMIAAGASLTDILTSLCTAIDEQNPDMMSMVMLMDPDGQRMWPAAAPRVPARFRQGTQPGDDRRDTCPRVVRRPFGRSGSSSPISPPIRCGRVGRRARLHSQTVSGPRGPSRSSRRTMKSSAHSGCSTLRRGLPAAQELCLIEDAANIAVIAIEGERSQAALQKAFVEIKDAEDCLRTMLDTIPTQAWSLLPDGTVAYLNQRWHDYTGSREKRFRLSTGVPKGRVDAADLLQVISHPDDAASEDGRLLNEILPAAKPAEFEGRLRRHDGEYRWFIIRIEPVSRRTRQRRPVVRNEHRYRRPQAS